MDNRMHFASATATEREIDGAVGALVDQIRGQTAGEPIDFALACLSFHFAPDAHTISEMLREALAPRALVGCTGEGVIGTNQEFERKPAITLLTARMPGVDFTPFALTATDLKDRSGDPAGLMRAVNAPKDTKLFVMVADPFSTPMDEVLDAFNAAFAGVPMIGGMASGSNFPGKNALIANDRVLRSGAVGAAFSGAFEADVIVSQGCRPIGPTFTVTTASENIIAALEGEPALVRIQDLLDELSDEDQALLRNGLFVGRAIDPRKDMLGRGDFLIRGVIGIDQKSGAISIGDRIEEGETIRFHLRDAATAKEDLEMMLTPHSLFGSPSGAFLFSCNGRGTRLYDHPNGDISVIQDFFSGMNVGGFFCAGEIGPVGGRNFLHGHTASLALFRPREKNTRSQAG